MIVTRGVPALLVGLTLVAGATMALVAAPPRGMPEELRGMPAEVGEAAAEIQQIVNQQRGLIDKARQAKTPAEREEVFRAVARNVQGIAQKRVVIMEQYAKHARARVEWARKHASEVRVSDLIGDMDGFAPRSPFAEKPDAPQRDDGPNQPAVIPKPLLSARNTLKQTMTRLQSLETACKRARSDEQRKKIKQEIEEHLSTIQMERVAILEAVLKLSEKRLQGARQRAKQAGVPPEIDPENGGGSKNSAR